MIAIYGMGFVGLTLAVTLAKVGHQVIGVEKDQDKLNLLLSGETPFFEPGLKEALLLALKQKKISFKQTLTTPCEMSIIAVGTPLHSDMTPDLTALDEVTSDVASLLREGDLVICRSTVPVGTLTKRLIPLLEKSGFIAHKDFDVLMAPERAIQGNALFELQNLPQILGFETTRALEKGKSLFESIGAKVYPLKGFESAELLKLINNSYRDLTFAFSNEVAKFCDSLNLDPFEIIQASNWQYPRGKIPSPSPGVGGPCLPKDSYLLMNSSDPKSPLMSFPAHARKVNDSMYELIFEKLQAFATKQGRELSSFRVGILGLAFKGYPETSNIAYSPAVEIVKRLPSQTEIVAFDPIVTKLSRTLERVKILTQPSDVFNHSDIVLLLTDHPLFRKLPLQSLSSSMLKPALIFDGWGIWRSQKRDLAPGICYSTFGRSCSMKENA